MKRRKALGLIGTSAGTLAAAGLYGGWAFLPPRASDPLGSPEDLAIRLFDSLDPPVRDRACVEYDHPLRQYHNRGVWGGGARISARAFSRDQRRILTDLLHAGLSEAGRHRIPDQFFINWPEIHLMKILVCGNPSRPPYQIVMSGPHLNLRIGGKSREGVAFGGPQVYGDQRGDYRQGLPRNVYRYQFEAGHRLFLGLDPSQRRAAVLPESPIQTQIELQGRGGSFPGIAVASLSRESRDIVGDLIDGILSTYPPDDVAYARACLRENGGTEALHLSYYQDGEVAGSGQYQIFRLEGPAAVLYFRGYPHVHAFVNIGMDGDAPLSVGEVLGENREALAGRAVKTLFEEAMKRQTGADFAYYDPDAVVGRLRTGVIRTGDIYILESWQDVVAVVEMKGSNIDGDLRDEIRAHGDDPDPGRVYTVATSGYTAGTWDRPIFGRVESSERGIPIRDAVIAHLRARWA